MVESSIAKTSEGAAHTNMTNNTQKITFFILVLHYLTFKIVTTHGIPASISVAMTGTATVNHDHDHSQQITRLWGSR